MGNIGNPCRSSSAPTQTPGRATLHDSSSDHPTPFSFTFPPPIVLLVLSELPEGKVLNGNIADLVPGLGQNSKELVDGIMHSIVMGLLGLVAGLGGLLIDLVRPALEVILVLLLADVFLLFDSLLWWG